MQIKINAIVKHVDEIVVEPPNGMGLEEFEDLITSVEKECHSINDIAQMLKEQHGFHIVSKELKPSYSIDRAFAINYMEKIR